MEDVATIIDPFNKALFAGPILRAQILLQTQDLIPTFKNLTPLNGIMDTLRRICKYDINIWKGGMSYMMVATANLFFIHWFIDKIKGVEDSQKEDWSKPFMIRPDPIISGAIMAWNAVFHPLEVLRVRSACHNFGLRRSILPQLLPMIQEIKNKEGIRGFYRGYAPITAYMVIQQDIFDPAIKPIGFDDTTRNLALRMFRDLTLYPLIVVGHRMIIDLPNPGNHFKSTMEHCKYTFKRFGVQGFYKGFNFTFMIQFFNSFPVFVYHAEAWAA